MCFSPNSQVLYDKNSSFHVLCVAGFCVSIDRDQYSFGPAGGQAIGYGAAARPEMEIGRL